MRFQLVHPIIFIVAVLVFGGVSRAGEKKLMHCFAFTTIEDAADADWKAFVQATSDLPEKVEGLNTVWVGKLKRPLRTYTRSGTDEKPEYTANLREWGVCMEMDDATILEQYADHPAHRDWEEAYFKVRVRGTTTYDILGQ